MAREQEMLFEVEKMIRGEEMLTLPPQKVIESQRYGDQRRLADDLREGSAKKAARHIEGVVDAPMLHVTKTSRLSKLYEGSLQDDISQLSSAFIAAVPKASTRFSATTTEAPTSAVGSATATAVPSQMQAEQAPAPTKAKLDVKKIKPLRLDKVVALQAED